MLDEVIKNGAQYETEDEGHRYSQQFRAGFVRVFDFFFSHIGQYSTLLTSG